jgi:hypothetical protein
MPIKRLARQFAEKLGYAVYNTRQPHIYSEDGLTTYHNHRFIDDPTFAAAYARGVKANGGGDHAMRWRAHVALWAATQAARLPGDFVECGVSTGFLSSAIMHKLRWNALGKRFFLFDTWEGLDARYVSEREASRLDWYKTLSFPDVERNFAEFERVSLIKGPVPETLDRAAIEKVAYLSLDMNCTEPEIAAITHFWGRLVPGGFIVLDDYAYSGYEEQFEAFNRFAAEHGVEIVSLPTGQGILIKPPMIV